MLKNKRLEYIIRKNCSGPKRGRNAWRRIPSAISPAKEKLKRNV